MTIEQLREIADLTVRLTDMRPGEDTVEKAPELFGKLLDEFRKHVDESPNAIRCGICGVTDCKHIPGRCYCSGCDELTEQCRCPDRAR